MGRADLHIHTRYSDGLMSPEELADYIEEKNRRHLQKHGFKFLDVIAIADHDEIKGALETRDYAKKKKYSFEVLIGEEIAANQGHILALNIKTLIPGGKSLESTLRQIHSQAGIAAAAHPFGPLHTFRHLQGIGHRIKTADIDAVETINSGMTEHFGNRLSQKTNRKERNLPELGNSDAHFLSAIGRAYTEFPGKSAKDLMAAIKNNKTKARGGVWKAKEFCSFIADLWRLRREWKKISLLSLKKNK